MRIPCCQARAGSRVNQRKIKPTGSGCHVNIVLRAKSLPKYLFLYAYLGDHRPNPDDQTDQGEQRRQCEKQAKLSHHCTQHYWISGNRERTCCDQPGLVSDSSAGPPVLSHVKMYRDNRRETCEQETAPRDEHERMPEKVEGDQEVIKVGPHEACDTWISKHASMSRV